MKEKISQLTGELKRARYQLQPERSVRIAEQKEAEKRMDSVQPAINLYDDFQNYLTDNDKKKVFERIEKHKRLHKELELKDHNFNDFDR